MSKVSYQILLVSHILLMRMKQINKKTLTINLFIENHDNDIIKCRRKMFLSSLIVASSKWFTNRNNQ